MTALPQQMILGLMGTLCHVQIPASLGGRGVSLSEKVGYPIRKHLKTVQPHTPFSLRVGENVKESTYMDQFISDKSSVGIIQIPT